MYHSPVDIVLLQVQLKLAYMAKLKIWKMLSWAGIMLKLMIERNTCSGRTPNGENLEAFVMALLCVIQWNAP